MLTRPLHAYVSAITAIGLTLGAVALPGGAPGALPVAAADVGCPGPVAPTSNAGVYGLSTPGHLQWVKENSPSWTDDFQLTGNIDMTGCTWDAGIGDSTTPFIGSFDGDGHSIDNVTVDLTGNFAGNTGAGGLFGTVGASATIADLDVSGDITVDITGGYAQAGGIVGYAPSGVSVVRSTFRGTVTALGRNDHSYAGGIVGRGDNVTLTDVGAQGHISASPKESPSGGGVIGVMTGTSQVTRSWAIVDVKVIGESSSYAGGIVGYGNGGTISQSFADVTAYTTSAHEPGAGGVAGRAYGMNIVDSYAMGDVDSTRMSGGIVGWGDQLNPASDSIQRSYFTGTISGLSGQIGGLAGRMDLPTNTDIEAPGVRWNTTTSNVTDAVGYSEYTGGGVINDPTVNGAQGADTSQMQTLQTFTAAGWDIANGYDANKVWSICPGYNDHYPFLGGVIGSDPCDDPAPTMSPGTQVLPATAGASVQTQPFTVSFPNPVYSVSPGLPLGLSMDTLTGVITGTIRGQRAATYTVTAKSTGLPLRKVTATITQPAELRFPRQISEFTVNSSDNGGFQTVADGPVNGSSLVLTYAAIEDNGTTTESYYTYVIDADGDVVHGPTNILPAGFTTSSYHQPSAAYNPITGGWLACYSRKLADPTSQAYCQYLNADGSAADIPFPIANPFTDQWNQNAIAYSDDSQAFLVAATSYGGSGFTGPIGRFVDANGNGAIGAVIDFQSGVGFRQSGGLDLVYSPASETFGLVSRGKEPADPQPAPYFFHLDSSGVPTQAPQRLLADTSVRMTNGSIAYDATADQFMVVGFDLMNDTPGPLVARGYDASTGTARGASPTLTTMSATDYAEWGSRPLITASDEASEFMVVTPMVPASSTTRGIFAMELDGNGAASPPVLISTPAEAASGFRPRVTFNDARCEYVATYNVNPPSWNWQLFSSSIPTTAPCTPSTPSAPLNATATAGDAKATVTWQLPTSAGTSAITAYQVTATPGGATCNATAPALTCEVTGLANGTSYTFEVRAQNTSGWGPYSQPSNAVTPAGAPGPAPTPSTPPSAPLSVTAAAGDATATVTWQAPAASGSSAITTYQVTSTPGGSTCLATAPSLTCQVTGLSNGTSYTFRVRGLNAAGWGEASAPSNAITPTAPAEQSIVIAGFRTNDGKGRRIIVNGTTTGMAGMVVTPYFRFPGRSDYRAGAPSLPIDEMGTFRWSRNAARKIFVYFDGGGVRSNNVVIAAR